MFFYQHGVNYWGVCLKKHSILKISLFSKIFPSSGKVAVIFFISVDP